MSNYSKLIAAVAGNLVAVLIAYLAVKVPAIAECVPAPAGVEEDLGQVCTVLGFSQVQITAALMIVINAIFVERSPANKPS